MNAAAPRAPKSSRRRVPATVEVSEIRSKDRVQFGRTYPGSVAEGHHAIIVPGASITLHGATPAGRRYVKGPDGRYISSPRAQLHLVHFELGDWAVYGGYNLTYTGRITSITEKTVTVVAYEGTSNARAHRLSLHDFDRQNWDYDAEEIAKRNNEWMD